MRIPRPPLAALTATLVAAVAVAGAVASVNRAEAFASTPKQNVINYLKATTGTSIVSGQHNKEPASNPAQYSQLAYNITGQWPGLWGGDMMFTATDIANRQSVINQAKAQWAAGSLVALTWHACSPTVGASCNFD